MQSNNPVFRRSEEFQRGGANIYGGSSATGAPVSDPSQWSVGTPGGTGYAPAPTQTGPMTIDTVVVKTAITLGMVIVAAIATWVLTPDVDPNSDTADLGPLFAAVTIGSLGAFALSMVNSFKRVISPPLVLAYAICEGVFIGAMSKVFEAQWPGIVLSAVPVDDTPPKHLLYKLNMRMDQELRAGSERRILTVTQDDLLTAPAPLTPTP